MIARFPQSTPLRSDLPWLRRRTLRRPATESAQTGRASTAVADFFAGRAARPGRGPAAPSSTPSPPPPPDLAASTSLNLFEGSPFPSSSLDLSAPEPSAAPPSLDLSGPRPGPSAFPSSDRPAPGPAPTPSVSSSLDLSAPEPAATPAPGAPAPPSRPRRRPVPRVEPGGRTILTPRDPTVTLNRVQSGVGTLTIEAVCSPTVGDLRLGALYELADSTTSIVQHATGIPTAPPSSRRPVLANSRKQNDRLIVDLRQSRVLRRTLVYAFSESGRELSWGGTLLVTTFGGARVEMPLDLGQHHGPIALLSVYNIDGELVLRAEAERVVGATREVARAFGYERITWADDSTPIL